MVTHNFRRWPVIETPLGDCTVFSDCCIIRVTLYILAPETPENTMHWPNADVMLGHLLQSWANIIPTKPFKLLTTNIIVNPGVQKCEPFSPQSPPLPSKWTQNQAK